MNWSGHAAIATGLLLLLILLEQTGTMTLFMGIFFLLVALLKMLDWRGFATAFSKYDIIAKKSKVYGYLYPIIEVGLGVGFLLQWNITLLASVTLLLMGVGSIGVWLKIRAGERLNCACLGTLIRVPLTIFTVYEDLTMGVMALMLLI